MCINDQVKKLRSVQLINDRCLELQKKKKSLSCNVEMCLVFVYVCVCDVM